ncbi:MAG TPA: DUF1416 domain-containing protein [Acidimicrobiales bacterium]|nr:DUF1416 domain-containing protein [Acidimicrobiales bacterium]
MPRLTGTIENGSGAFVQLRDGEGDFVGEVRADDEGRFTLYPIAGEWTVICLTPNNRREQHVDMGNEDVDIRVSA